MPAKSRRRGARVEFEVTHLVVKRDRSEPLVDRLGRSLQDLLAFLSEIHAAGVDLYLYLHVQGLDTSTPSGKAMFQMMGVFAEFERSLIQERVRAGLARARRHGTKTGNAIGRPRINAASEGAIRAALAAGKGVKKVAAEVGVGTGTVRRIKAAACAR